MQRLVASGVVRVVVAVGLAWALWLRDPKRTTAGGVLVLLVIGGYDRWRNQRSWDRRLAVIAECRQQSRVVVNAGVVAMSGGTVTVLGNAIGIQDVHNGDGSEE